MLLVSIMSIGTTWYNFCFKFISCAMVNPPPPEKFEVAIYYSFEDAYLQLLKIQVQLISIIEI